MHCRAAATRVPERRQRGVLSGGGIVRGRIILFVFIPLLAAGVSWGAGGMLFPTAQTTYSWPLRLGGRVGLSWLESVDASGHMFSATSVSVEVARDGFRLGLGNRYQAMYFLPLYGGGLSVSGMHLWEGTDATYVGLEASVSAVVLTLSGGAYRRIAGDRRDDFILSLGVGSGLP